MSIERKIRLRFCHVLGKNVIIEEHEENVNCLELAVCKTCNNFYFQKK